MRKLLAISFFRTELMGDRELRHDRIRIDIIHLHLIHYLLRVGQHLWNVRKDGRHLFRRFQPLLLGIVHAPDIRNVFVGRETNQKVVRFRMLFFYEMRIVGANYLHSMFLSQINQDGIHLLLTDIDVHVSIGFVGLMALNFNIIIFSKNGFKPFD